MHHIYIHAKSLAEGQVDKQQQPRHPKPEHNKKFHRPSQCRNLTSLNLFTPRLALSRKLILTQDFRRPFCAHEMCKSIPLIHSSKRRSKLPRQQPIITLYSCDRRNKANEEERDQFSHAFLDQMNARDVPPHTLRLRVGDLDFLMRNYSQKDKLTNNSNWKH